MERFQLKKRPSFFKTNKRIIKIGIVIMVFSIILLMNEISHLVERTLHVLCEAKVESIGITISNKAIDEVMQGVSYEDLVTFLKNEEGQIVALKSNIVKMNQISSEIAIRIQEMYDNLEKIYVYVPLRKFYRK